MSSPSMSKPNPALKRKSTIDFLLAIGEGKVKTFNLVMKMVQSSLSMVLVFIHAGEMHVMNSQTQGKQIVGMFYPTCIMAFPIYLLARASSAVWKKRWIPNVLDATMNAFASAIYLGMFFFVLMNLNNTDLLKAPFTFPKQHTPLNQTAVCVRLLLNFFLFVLLLFEALTHFLRSKLHSKLLKIRQRRATAFENAQSEVQPEK